MWWLHAWSLNFRFHKKPHKPFRCVFRSYYYFLPEVGSADTHGQALIHRYWPSPVDLLTWGNTYKRLTITTDSHTHTHLLSWHVCARWQVRGSDRSLGVFAPLVRRSLLHCTHLIHIFHDSGLSTAQKEGNSSMNINNMSFLIRWHTHFHTPSSDEHTHPWMSCPTHSCRTRFQLTANNGQSSRTGNAKHATADGRLFSLWLITHSLRHAC